MILPEILAALEELPVAPSRSKIEEMTEFGMQPPLIGEVVHRGTTREAAEFISARLEEGCNWYTQDR